MTARLRVDVAVVGGGPAGLAAAAHAAEAGARVVVLEAAPRLGGQIWRHRGIPPPALRKWQRRIEGARVQVLTATTVVDAPSGGSLFAVGPTGAVRVEAQAVVLANGARELFLPFPGWTLPGSLGAGAAQALVKSGARFDGLRAVVAGSGPLLFVAANALADAGARVLAVAEQAPRSALLRFGIGLLSHPSKLAAGLVYRARLGRGAYSDGTWVVEALGGERLEAVVLTDGRRRWTVPCDVLACGFGLVANTELARLLGCAVGSQGALTDGRLGTSRPGIFAAGEVAGIGGVELALARGEVAGRAAAGARVPRSAQQRLRRAERFAARLAHAFPLRPELLSLARPETLVCRCEAVPWSALHGHPSARAAKLATRAGMGSCQGRVCGAALHYLRGWEFPQVRPPLEPVSLSQLEECS